MHPITRCVRPALSLLLAGSIPACDVPDDELGTELELGESEEFPLAAEPEHHGATIGVGGLTTGRRLNTNRGGGHQFDELPLFGGEHEGVWLHEVLYFPAGVDGNGQGIGFPEPLDIPSIQVVGGGLEASTIYGQGIGGDMWGSTIWVIETPSGLYDLLVETGFDGGSSTPLYAFYWRPHDTTELPQSTCLDPGEEQVTTAAVYRGIDVHADGSMSPHPDLLYIGCTAGAVGKASLWGYRPDYGAIPNEHGADALAAFEASVRMLRADYCGDGQSWTLPGTGVYVRDKMGVNDSLSGLFVWPGPQDEAVWGMDGALCVDLPRIHQGLYAVPGCVPPCWFGASNWFSGDSAMFQTASDL